MTNFSPEARRKSLWSTESAAALGLSPYKTPVQLWMEKWSGTPSEDISKVFAVRLGLAMQAPLAAMHMEDTGDELVPLDKTEHVTIIADTPLGSHYDEYNKTRARLHEIKCFGDARRRDFGEAGTDEIPMDVLAQVLHQQAVWRKASDLPLNGTEVNVSFGNRERLLFYVPLDVDAIAALVAKLSEFWRNVKDGVSPPARTPEDTAALFPRSNKGTKVAATPEVEQWCARLLSLKEEADDLETRINIVKTDIQSHMKDADDLIGPDGRTLATWRTAAGAVKIDADRLRLEQPAIAQQYSVAGKPTRRFLVK